MSRPFRRQDFDAPAFYDALNKIRNLRDFTWRQVSAASGVSTTTLSRMGDGRHPDAASLAALSHWGGMNPANFMTDPSKPPYDNSLTAIVARLRASIAWLRDGKSTENGGIGLGDMIDMLPIIEAALTPSPAPSAAQAPSVDAVPGEPVAKVCKACDGCGLGIGGASCPMCAGRGTEEQDEPALATPVALRAAPHQGADALREALARLELAVDWHLGRSAFTQSTQLKGTAHGKAVRKELYAAHDAARAALAQHQAPQQGEQHE